MYFGSLNAPNTFDNESGTSSYLQLYICACQDSTQFNFVVDAHAICANNSVLHNKSALVVADSIVRPFYAISVQTALLS